MRLQVIENMMGSEWGMMRKETKTWAHMKIFRLISFSTQFSKEIGTRNPMLSNHIFPHIFPVPLIFSHSKQHKENRSDLIFFSLFNSKYTLRDLGHSHVPYILRFRASSYRHSHEGDRPQIRHCIQNGPRTRRSRLRER